MSREIGGDGTIEGLLDLDAVKGAKGFGLTGSEATGANPDHDRVHGITKA